MNPMPRPMSAVPAWQVLFCLALLLFTSGLAQAAELRWRNAKPFQIVAADKPLPDFLRELAASQGTTAVVDPKIQGIISGKFSGPPLAILNSVCATNGLSWYYDGAFLHVEPANDARSEVLPVTSGNTQRVAEALAQLQITDSRYPLTLIDREGQGSLHVAGPKRYIEMVKQTLKLVDQRAAAVASEQPTEIRLFPLRYAWANDVKIMRAGRETSIPGVASMLRNLFSKSAFGGGLGRTTGSPISVGPTRQLKLRSGESISAPKIEMNTASSNDDGSTGLSSFSSGELPQFQADTRMNAVIVRDYPQRMAHYAQLIAAMDVRPKLIEIEVTIMDISTDTLASLGIDWRLHGRHGDFQTGRGDRPPLTWNGMSESGQVGSVGPNNTPLTPLGAMFSAAIGHDARNYLLARVNALAQRGNANFVARPKVLTLDNNEAILENLQEFYVRVNGFQDAGLFSVTTGTAVRVTPLLVEDAAATRGMMMSINIEDGDLSNVLVDQIPIVRRRSINTQALVDEGQSLLIAGYTSEEKTQATTGVPLLSDLPVVGNLFKHNEKKQVNMERFYLLTPKLVSTGGSTAPTLNVPPPPAGASSPAAPVSEPGRPQ